MRSLIWSSKNFNVVLCFYKYSLRATFYFVWALVFKRYVNICCTRFLANAACTFGAKANWLPFFGKVCGVPKISCSYLCDCPINVYSVFKLKLATHIQAHSDFCSDRGCILQYCGVCRTSAGCSCTRCMQVESSSPSHVRDFLDGARNVWHQATVVTKIVGSLTQ